MGPGKGGLAAEQSLRRRYSRHSLMSGIGRRQHGNRELKAKSERKTKANLTKAVLRSETR